MPINTKVYDGNLFDQLSLGEDILEVAETEDAPKTVAIIEKKIKQIKRKLYETPPLTSNDIL